MKKTILLLILILLSFNTFSQTGWVWQNPLPQGNTLQSVCYINAPTGIAVGGSGTILRTTNSGSSWEVTTSGTTSDLYSVFFIDANTGAAAGVDGTILRTTNGGVNWSIQSTGTVVTLLSIHFINANTGTAVGEGGTILRTTNNGAN